jgi:putative restriction endonuclease
MNLNLDLQIRTAAFNWLSEATSLHGDVLDRTLLAKGFKYQGHRIPLVSPQGIFKPQMMDFPLTITTVSSGPYDDSLTSDEYLMYRYRGTDPRHWDNVGLRRLFELQLPLIYFYGLVPGRYLAMWPVFIVGDDPMRLTFKVALDEHRLFAEMEADLVRLAEGAEARRTYLTSAVRQRLHQRGFREKVLHAYHTQCTFCQIRHRELLDAAHIIPDTHSEGSPLVDNGLSLCKLHHAAFDSFMIGVSPQFLIFVRDDILAEEDGPMLQHGLKGLHRQEIVLPSQRSDWPDPDKLDWRFQQFVQFTS